MRFLMLGKRVLALLLSVTTLLLGVQVSCANAAMVSTHAMAAAVSVDQQRARVSAFIASQQAQAVLVSLGVSAEQAQARVQTLTADQAQLLVSHLDAQQAGQGLGVVAIITMFLVITGFLLWLGDTYG